MSRKSGHSHDWSISRMNNLVERVKGIYFDAIRRNETQTYILKRMKAEVFDSPNFKLLPVWATTHIQAYGHGIAETIWSFMTVFAYKYGDKLYQTGPSKKLGLVDWPTWDELYDFKVNKPTGIHPATGKYESFGEFEKAECIESGAYWPSGKPYYVSVGTHKVLETVS